ncbi:phospho-sugar mutase [Parasphaerochaeta coccoides]|uniref:Phosphoglucomutase/phosphomannomutase alpha/beta/alpha domain I n=1 Tax=Parasphaerochaeta coccoides (strain ATCC BAA-1237 / DSM 17374 / SPN1) TaxID=760011 RepID=F4GJH4_PARC1|nr:phospho-sugar mutase [Parasphaerochaeta coccoides]AEC02239.1 phosphoglucomutase/phosphomannomutase alpha/beta/alpha domain I [Parasphaerochaeta coccoides DSM 17374]
MADYDIGELKKKAENYRDAEKHPVFRKEVDDLLAAQSWDELHERFYTTLSFGTAGIRGIIGGGTNRINPLVVRTVSAALGRYMVSMTAPDADPPSIVIAYDSRRYSDLFAREAALTLAASGVHVYLFDTLHPVPLLSFAVRHLGALAGVVITASHNPAAYNGYKVYWSDGAQVTPPHDKAIAEIITQVDVLDIPDMEETEARASGRLESVPASVDNAYYEAVLASIRRPDAVRDIPVTVVYSPLHGSGNIPVRNLLERLGVTTIVVPEQEKPDGAFPTVALPNPESAKAMEMALKLGKERKADIILGTDPDADRLGIAVPVSPDKSRYELLNGNQIAILLFDYLAGCYSALAKGRDDVPSAYPPGSGRKTPVLVKSIVTTDVVRRIAEDQGIVCREVLTGFKYVAEELAVLEGSAGDARFFLFGAEESYGYLTVPFVRDKDAVSTAVVAVEMLCAHARRGISLYERLHEIYREYGFSFEAVVSNDYAGSAGKQKMQEIMEKFRGKTPGDVLLGSTIQEIVDYASGAVQGLPKADVLVFYLSGGVKLVVRPSGTEPKIKYYLFHTADHDMSESVAREQFDCLVARIGKEHT